MGAPTYENPMPTLYLDSSDYSNLTNDRLLEREPQLKSTLAYLRDATTKGSLQVFFSSAHVSEMLPLNVESIPLARRKLRLMRELCGNNVLRSIVDVGRIEIECLNAAREPPKSMLAPDARWLPRIDFKMRSAVQRAEEKLAEKNATRAVRRKAMPVLVKHYREANAAGVEALITNGELPCPPGFNINFVDAAREAISWAELNKRFNDAFNDFDNLSSAIETAPDFARRLRNIVRAPGEFNGSALRAMAERIDMAPESDAEKRAVWRTAEERGLKEILSAFFEHHGLFPEREFGKADIQKFCPGIYSMVISDWRFLAQAFFGGNRKGLTDSTYVDSIHALYAPYVDIFRCDTEMAPHIKFGVNGRKTNVVRKLNNLVEEIEDAIGS